MHADQVRVGQQVRFTHGREVWEVISRRGNKVILYRTATDVVRYVPADRLRYA